MVGCEVAPAPLRLLAPAVRYRRDQGIIKRHARHRTTTGITDRLGCLHFSHVTRCINVIDFKLLRSLFCLIFLGVRNRYLILVYFSYFLHDVLVSL